MGGMKYEKVALIAMLGTIIFVVTAALGLRPLSSQ